MKQVVLLFHIHIVSQYRCGNNVCIVICRRLVTTGLAHAEETPRELLNRWMQGEEEGKEGDEAGSAGITWFLKDPPPFVFQVTARPRALLRFLSFLCLAPVFYTQTTTTRWWATHRVWWYKIHSEWCVSCVLSIYSYVKSKQTVNKCARSNVSLKTKIKTKIPNVYSLF